MGILPHAGFRAGLRRGPAYSALDSQELLLRDRFELRTARASHQARPAMNAVHGMVRIHAQTMVPAMPHRTADTECVDPTPTMEPVMVWVVDTGMPSEVARNRVIEPESSAQKPSTGRILVMRWPIVLTMRQPPNIVPRPIVT